MLTDRLKQLPDLRTTPLQEIQTQVNDFFRSLEPDAIDDAFLDITKTVRLLHAHGLVWLLEVPLRIKLQECREQNNRVDVSLITLLSEVNELAMKNSIGFEDASNDFDFGSWGAEDEKTSRADHNPLTDLGIEAAEIRVNWNEARLYQQAVRTGEGQIAKGGALLVKTGKHTGRSAKDKFTVRDESTENTVWWDNNASMTPAHFDALWEDFQAHLKGKTLYTQQLFGGADLDHRVPFRIVTEFSWHSLLTRHLLRIPTTDEYEGFAHDFTIINSPSFRADPAKHGTLSETVIAVDFAKKLVLIGGTSYAGETKKSVFTILNYILPTKGVMPMHCSVNDGGNDDAAIFFGLSGTGKTTLAADASRTLIGDDEHGWSENGLFNFEGGCYAKMINLSPENEPEIYATTGMWGTILENVVMDPETRELDFFDNTLAENSRGAYPISAIENASLTGRCGQPKNLIMLTCDAFGVMPPIAKLTPAQAIYHFLSGYTAKVAGTEKGVTEPTATFSTCFGGPFMPRHPSEYGKLLGELINRYDVNCWLVSTGWTGGAHGVGARIPIKATRALLNAVRDGSFHELHFRKDPTFGFMVPTELEGVDPIIFNPRETWDDKIAYDAQVEKLATMFVENFKVYEAHVDELVLKAAPIPDRMPEYA